MRFLMVNAVHDPKPGAPPHSSLGMGYVASSLRRTFGNGITFKVIDGDMAAGIKSFQPDLVGISSMSRNWGAAKECARIAKQAGLPVIVGGVHITELPQTLTSDMDVGIICEGELATLELLEMFQWFGALRPAALEFISGIVYWDGDELKTTEPRALIQDLDTVPYPARDLLPITTPTNMLTSRGCPFDCAFCATAHFSRNQTRYASADYVVGEIEQMRHEYGARHITIYDDLFATKTDRVVAIQQGLARKNLLRGLSFSVNIRADLITDEMAEILHAMNVKVLAFGAESGCAETLAYLKSGSASVETNAQAIRILRRHHIRPYCAFIIGSPHEDMAGAMQTVRFIEDNRLNDFDLFLMTPYPGTRIWDYAVGRGLVSEDMDWPQLDMHLNSNPLIISEKMTLVEIQQVTYLMDARKRRHYRRIKWWIIIKMLAGVAWRKVKEVS
jgi:anaerobic magnesium-protoporphyrin IX monomethyl ester cyclase